MRQWQLEAMASIGGHWRIGLARGLIPDVQALRHHHWQERLVVDRHGDFDRSWRVWSPRDTSSASTAWQKEGLSASANAGPADIVDIAPKYILWRMVYAWLNRPSRLSADGFMLGRIRARMVDMEIWLRLLILRWLGQLIRPGRGAAQGGGAVHARGEARGGSERDLLQTANSVVCRPVSGSAGRS